MDVHEKLTKEHLKQIEEILQNAPEQELYFRQMPVTWGKEKMPGPRDQF